MEPTILFFRRHPKALANSAVLASSIQSLETSFFLIALRRFPHALATCSTAIETAIQASDAGAEDRDSLQILVKKAKAKSKLIDDFSNEELCRFRKMRNRIIHRGYTPKDDSETSSLLLEVGFPFLTLCYSELHSFDVKAGLLPDYSEQIDIATRVYLRAKELSDLDLSYCWNGFGHLIRWCFKRNFSSSWEIDALMDSGETGMAFQKIERVRYNLECLFNAHWSFDCPICDDIGSVVCEIEANMLELLKVVPLRMACTRCEFVVRDSQPFLSELLLEQQVAAAQPRIFEDHGIQ